MSAYTRTVASRPSPLPALVAHASHPCTSIRCDGYATVDATTWRPYQQCVSACAMYPYHVHGLQPWCLGPYINRSNPSPTCPKLPGSKRVPVPTCHPVCHPVAAACSTLSPRMCTRMLALEEVCTRVLTCSSPTLQCLEPGVAVGVGGTQLRVMLIVIATTTPRPIFLGTKAMWGRLQKDADSSGRAGEEGTEGG